MATKGDAFQLLRNALDPTTGLNVTVLSGGGGNTFGTISVSGQDDVVADSTTDTLTLVAGTNITITTTAASDTIEFAASGAGTTDDLVDNETIVDGVSIGATGVNYTVITNSAAGDPVLFESAGTDTDIDVRVSPKGTGAFDVQGNITVTGTVDGRDLATDGSKLDGIEASATADQTAADIRGLGFFDTTNDGAASGLDADLLDGNEATAFATSAQGSTADTALQDVVDDTTPQLGGSLDVNGQSIVSASAGDIAVTPDTTGDIILDGQKWPQADGTPSQVLQTNGSGQLAWVTLSGGLGNIVEDTTPQLGGSLDVNGQKIVSVSGGDIDIEPDGTGNVLLGNFTFDADQTVGAGQDNFVLTYDNGTGLLSLEASSGGLANIVEDTTPQLGGNLDVNGNSIVSASDGDITITPNGTGDILLNPDSAGTGFVRWNPGGTDAITWTVVSGTTATEDAPLGLTYTGSRSITSGAWVFSGTSSLAMGAKKITNVGDPSAAQDAVTLTYIQSNFLQDIVSDTTPQLGGDLDLNSNAIDFPTTANISDCLDEDNMASDSATALATQQSIKAYADTKSAITRTVNAQTGTSYQIALSDAGNIVTMANAASNTLTIPLNATVAFAVGTQIDVVMYGAGTTTVDAVTSVLLNGIDDGSATIDARYKAVTIVKVATDDWIMMGAHGTVA